MSEETEPNESFQLSDILSIGQVPIRKKVTIGDILQTLKNAQEKLDQDIEEIENTAQRIRNDFTKMIQPLQSKSVDFGKAIGFLTDKANKDGFVSEEVLNEVNSVINRIYTPDAK